MEGWLPFGEFERKKHWYPKDYKFTQVGCNWVESFEKGETNEEDFKEYFDLSVPKKQGEEAKYFMAYRKMNDIFLYPISKVPFAMSFY